MYKILVYITYLAINKKKIFVQSYSIQKYACFLHVIAQANAVHE